MKEVEGEFEEYSLYQEMRAMKENMAKAKRMMTHVCKG